MYKSLVFGSHRNYASCPRLPYARRRLRPPLASRHPWPPQTCHCSLPTQARHRPWCCFQAHRPLCRQAHRPLCRQARQPFCRQATLLSAVKLACFSPVMPARTEGQFSIYLCLFYFDFVCVILSVLIIKDHFYLYIEPPCLFSISTDVTLTYTLFV